jgi:hypothetical protein
MNYAVIEKKNPHFLQIKKSAKGAFGTFKEALDFASKHALRFQERTGNIVAIEEAPNWERVKP